MQVKKPVERRRGSRLHVGIESVVLRYRVAGSTKPKKEVLCKDINMSGLRFLAGERLAPGTPLELEIFLKSKEEPPITVGGKVVWQKPFGAAQGKEFETGISLDQMKEADQAGFTDFVFSTLHQMFKRKA